MTTPNNLPAELTSFVGREPQLAELRRILHRSRLVTLTGPGGAGKTRLALRLASESLDKFPDGVWLLELAPIGEGRLLERSLAGIASIKEDPSRSMLDVLLESLANRRLVLVLDGCEHLVDACADLTSRLLRACPKLTILATSREPLGVAGEVIWRTPSLTTPPPDDTTLPELLMESEAVRLFVDRARLNRSDFELDAAGAPAVAQICIRLEGMPLAVELAAGLTGVMTLDEILARLRHRFRLLTGGSRTSLPRHQTLRQAMDWSYGLLSDPEQALFERLSVFAGGFDLDAAEAVVNGEPLGADDVLPVISRLVNKSLVVAEPSGRGTTRFRMLDTLREYAQEKLQQTGEADWRRRHAMYFDGWIADASRQLQSADQVGWLRRCDEEKSNIRLALEWSMSDLPDNALRLVASMGAVWLMERQFSEGLEWLNRALELDTDNPRARAAALVTRARMSRRRGDWITTLHDAEKAIELTRGSDLRQELGRALNVLGMVNAHSGDLAAAAASFSEAQEIAEEIGDYERAASSLNNLAMIESGFGRLESALAQVDRALSIAQRIGDRFLAANILDTAGRINLRLGELSVARSKYEEGLRISLEFRDSVNIADLIEGLGLIAGKSGEADRSLVLMTAAERLRTIAGVEPTAEWTSEVQEGINRARARLGRAAADAAINKASSMTLDEAVAFALGTTAGERRNGGSRLTDREVQVARLISSGLTNGEVAGRLRISQRTVDAHVEHIRNKIGLRTRSQIAVWAKERLGTG